MMTSSTPKYDSIISTDRPLSPSPNNLPFPNKLLGKKKLPKTYLLIEWPASQRIEEHPETWPVEVGAGNFAFIAPPEVWEKYKNTYYKKQEGIGIYKEFSRIEPYEATAVRTRKMALKTEDKSLKSHLYNRAVELELLAAHLIKISNR